ncbi:thioesterase II family protein [Streptomyces alanosinicus]|uniref:AlaF n=1 Tax=Streptomyces alanosinicus TaxID=68171 RepID=A0A6B9JIH6_9ACTN|nr:alpha/beta fold hydrolase [Streptomyces alanosinicus]QGZ20046.1 thioesterase [Streptomyces alanosinicus]QJA42408.1 AlaF [Streptomyces alanosinicus]GHE14737.1 thioesterase [Streptomyces alanosinicus]
MVNEKAVVVQGKLHGTTDAVLFLPPAGSVTSPFFPVGAHLPQTLPALHCELPGRGRLAHDAAPSSVSAAADRWADDLTALLPGGRRLHLFGHSLGALLAYELAIRLEARPQYTIGSLSVSGARDPGSTPRTAVAAAFEALRRNQSTTDKEDDAEGTWLAQDLRMRREHSVTQRPIHTPLALFCGDSDPFARPADMAQWASFTTGPLLGTFAFPGGHDYYLSDRASVATTITDLVERC